jgi:hypothetical protein
MHRVAPSVRRQPSGAILSAFALAIVLTAASAFAQQPQPTPTPAPAPAEEARTTGLPGNDHWTFNLDAGLGGFGFANSLYTDVRPDPSGNLGDNWAEGFAKPAISATFGLGDGEVYGKVSAVGERTFAAPPSLVGEDASSFKVEDLSLGWRSGKSIGSSENLLDFTVGRTQYKIGHGLLLWDGAGEGGSRGGFWSNARKAWQFAAVARVKPKNHTFEAFYLDRDEVPENDSSTRLWGGNYELALGETSTFGVSYMKFYADKLIRPDRDGMDVFDVRAFTSPFKSVPGLSFEVEYAHETNGERLGSDAFNGQVGYQFDNIYWKPKLSYRYALFGGDDVATAKNEGFDSLLPGFYDWGSWWQGEIAGEYFLSNSNLISQQLRLHLTPTDAIGTGLIFFKFNADQADAYGPGVISDDIAVEMDWYMDWKLNKNFTLSLVGAFANPGGLVRELYGRTDNFTYGMAYLAYSY